MHNVNVNVSSVDTLGRAFMEAWMQLVDSEGRAFDYLDDIEVDCVRAQGLAGARRASASVSVAGGARIPSEGTGTASRPLPSRPPS